MKRLVALITVAIVIAFFSSGCQWMGQMTAKAEKGINKGVEKMENGIKKMENDFQKGQEDEKKDD